MMKLTLSAAALAMSMAFAPLAASAQQAGQLDYNCCDANKDGMISKQEFLDEMGKRYDKAMEMAKKMPAADQAKMMKGTQLTIEGFNMMMKELYAR